MCDLEKEIKLLREKVELLKKVKALEAKESGGITIIYPPIHDNYPYYHPIYPTYPNYPWPMPYYTEIPYYTEFPPVTSTTTIKTPDQITLTC